MGLLGKVIISAIVPNLIYVLIFHRKKEFKYLWGIAKTMIFSKFKKNINLNNELTI